MKTLSRIALPLFFLMMPTGMFSQQIADSAYQPDIRNPAYSRAKGPVIYIDEGHHNFHTRTGRYLPFANVLESDGYCVKSYEGSFTPGKLHDGKILVIANALNEKNVEDWFLPTPSAFTREEIGVVKNWVSEGGSLFLIADHMPMAGAAKELAAAFGFEFTNGFAIDTLGQGPDLFDLQNKTLIGSEITRGRSSLESVDHVVTFTGQGFKIPKEATPILLLKPSFINLQPDTAWAFKPDTPKFNIGGWSQGSFRHFGKGRVVVFGEAAMFTAQLAGPNKARVGMNSEAASQNYRLLLNIIHWLDGIQLYE